MSVLQTNLSVRIAVKIIRQGGYLKGDAYILMIEFYILLM